MSRGHYWTKVMKERDLNETILDHDEPVSPKQARYWLRSGKNGGLIIAPRANNSYEWAGGGMVSTTKDLAKFGTAFAYTNQEKPPS